MTFASFFPAKGIIASFTYTDDEKDYCIKPDDDTETRYFQCLEIFLYMRMNGVIRTTPFTFFLMSNRVERQKLNQLAAELPLG